MFKNVSMCYFLAFFHLFLRLRIFIFGKRIVYIELIAYRQFLFIVVLYVHIPAHLMFLSNWF